MATSSPVVAASAAKAATPAEAAAKLGATYPHEQMATRPLDLNPAHWYAAIKWHYDGGTLNWPMIIYIGLCHYWAVLGLTRLATVHTYTLLWAYVLWPITGLGITAGVHRLWSHRSYTAGPALRCLLMLMNSIANQGSIFHWARDHRVHHKHSETTADRHNAQRGFFYAHVGWLLCKKHPDVVKEGKKLDFNDLKRDGFVMFQRKLDPWFTMFMCFAFPGLVAKFGWGERFWDAVWVAGFLRYIFVLHSTWLVNSAAHIFGDHPYNEQWPAENPIVSFFAVGEGWHNWHHQYRYDYAASEFGITSQFNPTKLFIDFFCLLGMASNPKRATSSWERTKTKRDKEARCCRTSSCAWKLGAARADARATTYPADGGGGPAPSSPWRIRGSVRRRRPARDASRRIRWRHCSRARNDAKASPLILVAKNAKIAKSQRQTKADFRGGAGARPGVCGGRAAASSVCVWRAAGHQDDVTSSWFK